MEQINTLNKFLIDQDVRKNNINYNYGLTIIELNEPLRLSA